MALMKSIGATSPPMAKTAQNSMPNEGMLGSDPNREQN
jgi:hypothetical protein